MSRHYKSKTNEVAHMILDAKNMTHTEMIKTYNSEVWEDGQVYDLTDDKVYSNIPEWANATIEDDEDDFEYSEFFDTDWEEE